MAGYGIDVLDPAVTPRRLDVLARRLPPWAQSPGEPWSAEAELLALLVDHVANLTWVTIRASGSRNAPKPRPVPRPMTGRRGRERPRETTTQPPGGRRDGGGWAATMAELAAVPGVIVDG